MKICIVSTQYPPLTATGGIATFVGIAAPILARRGHKVTVISVSRDGSDTRTVVDGVELWRLPETRPRATLREDLRRNWQVWRAVSQIKPDMVQMVDFRAEGFLTAILSSKRTGLVTLLDCHRTLTKVRREEPFSFHQEALSFMALRQARRSQAVFASSVFLARQVERDSKFKPDSIQAIYHALNMAEINIFRQTSPEISVSGAYIIYFGRVEERKGMEYLAKALPQVWQKLPYLKVVLAGLYSPYSIEGQPVRQYFEELAGRFASNLVFTGHLAREQVLPLVAKAKLAVLPSIWEPFGFTCAEALALGVPVVTTGDSGGPGEIIGGLNDNEVEPDSVPAGWLVPRRNSVALASAIIEALTDLEAQATVKKRLEKRLHRFEAERMVDKIEALYFEIYRKLGKFSQNPGVEL